MVVVDTNIIIDHIRQPDDKLTYLRKLATLNKKDFQGIPDLKLV